MVAGTPAVRATRPDAIACLTLLSSHRLFTITWEFETSSVGIPVTSPFLNPMPTVNGTVPVIPAVNWNEVTTDPLGGGGGGVAPLTVSVNVVVRVRELAEPVMVIVDVPA